MTSVIGDFVFVFEHVWHINVESLFLTLKVQLPTDNFVFLTSLCYLYLLYIKIVIVTFNPSLPLRADLQKTADPRYSTKSHAFATILN